MTRAMIRAMAKAMVKRVILFSFLIALISCSSRPPQDPMADFPKIILWAWERPEDLRFIDVNQVGIAFLAATIFLSGDSLVIKPRYQPVSFPPNCKKLSVVRIEIDHAKVPTLSQDQSDQLVKQLNHFSQIEGVAGLQIDFDATKSQREFYRQSLINLKKVMEPHKRLSITALASWTLYDDWISNLPVDEAIPMLFRMGVEERQVRSYLTEGKEFKPGISQYSVGFSLDEPFVKIPAGRRIYLFNPGPWSQQALNEALKKVKNNEKNNL